MNNLSKIALYGMVFSLPFTGWSLFNIGESFGFDATYLFGCLLIILTISSPTTRRGTLLNQKGFHIIFLFCLAPLISAIAIFNNHDFLFPQYIQSILHFTFYILLLFSVLQQNLKSSDFIGIYSLGIFVGYAVAIYGLYQFVARLSNLPFATLELTSATQSTFTEDYFFGVPRISSFFSEPGWFAQYIFKTLIWMIGIYSIKNAANVHSFKDKLAYFTFFFLFVTCIFMSASGGTITVAITISLVYFTLNLRESRKTIVTIFAIVVVVLQINSYLGEAFGTNVIDGMTQRVTGVLTGNWIEGESMESRSQESAISVRIFSEKITNSLFGVGFGQSPRYVQKIYQIVGTKGISNFYLLILAECGIIGLSCFSFSLSLIGKYIYTSRIYLDRMSFEDKIILNIVLFNFLADIVSLNFVGNFLSAKYWITLGLSMNYCNYISLKYTIK